MARLVNAPFLATCCRGFPSPPAPALRPSLSAARSVAHRHRKRCFRQRASSPRWERGGARWRGTNSPEANSGLKLSKQGGAATSPLQEAERNRCREGRAAWMPREACGARDGPSRRALGATMERGKRSNSRRLVTPAKPGPDAGASFLVPFHGAGHPATGKGTRPGGRNRKPPPTRQ
ncbi:hypothetical protein E8F11_19490 [Pseudomonas sp. BN417]|nr:hypothetical protein [Pseudomonas sp. BN417]